MSGSKNRWQEAVDELNEVLLPYKQLSQVRRKYGLKDNEPLDPALGYDKKAKGNDVARAKVLLKEYVEVYGEKND